MNISELMCKVKGGNLSDLILASELNNESVNQWIKEANINKEDMNKIYIDKTFLMKLYYWDKDKGIIFEVNVFGEFEKQKSCVYELYNNSEWERLLIITPTSYQLEVLQQLLKNNCINDDDKYKLFMSCYVHSDYGFSKLDINLVEDVIASKTYEDKKEIAEKIAHLPDKLTIYRGEGTLSTSYSESFSWTLNENIAYFFGCRLSNGAVIYTATVDKKDIVDYIKKEEEILALPKDVHLISKNHIYGLKDIVFSDNLLYHYDVFREILRNMPFARESDEHDKTHCLRVLNHALYIAELENIPMSKEDYNTLCFASITHDSGRVNDMEDSEHGAMSYEFSKKYIKICEKYGLSINEDLYKFLVTFHSISDEEAIKYLKNNKCDDSWRTLLWVLKDADALDRVRFGISALDVNFLRFKESKKLVCYAMMAKNNIKL